jgi:hypothetical protein
MPVSASRTASAAGRFGQVVKCARLRLVAATQPHSIRRPGGRPLSTVEFLPRRASRSEAGAAPGEVRPHLATGEFGAATPAQGIGVGWVLAN